MISREMLCPFIEDLPTPPPGKTGWPWTEASPLMPPVMEDGRAWPRISIITPSLNQASYLEETIRSVLLQGYPDLEYVIIDGGSTDATSEIIEKYQQWLSFYISEPDNGQVCAINKGLLRVSGEVFNWINSDDFLLPHSLQVIAEAYRQSPESVLAGDVKYRYEDSDKEEVFRQENLDIRGIVEFWNNSTSFHQPGVFIPLPLMQQVGMLDVGLHYAFDYELLCRLLSVTDVAYVKEPVATYRIHSASKSVSRSHFFMAETYAASKR